MDTDNPFRTTDPNSEEEDETTKKLKVIWCGIANSTNQELKISIRTYASLPDSTQGRHSIYTFLLQIHKSFRIQTWYWSRG